jgi:Leucine-rich repeat (LRR) protein
MLNCSFVKLILTLYVIYLTGMNVYCQKLMTKLQLDTCRIFSLTDLSTDNPESIIVLDLSGIGLKEIPTEIFRFNNLQRLNLANNNISELSNGLFKLKNLQELNLEENKLIGLPSEIGNLQNLKKLNLTRTKVPYLPDEFAKLINLESLNLSWNDLNSKSIKTIFKLKELKILNLQRNLIDSLSQEIGNLDKLQILNLNFNPLGNLPEEIGNLLLLREIDLGKNTELHVLPEGFKKLVQLNYINLEQVPLSDIELKKLPKIDPENIEH